MNHGGQIQLQDDGKGYFLLNGTESYYKKLRLAYKDIKDDNVTEYSYFSFFILCAATLEYSLNFMIADYCFGIYGHKKCKTHIEGYVSLNFKKKVFMIPSILSNGKLMFNEDKTAYKKLNELISLRNKIMHAKELITTVDFFAIKNMEQQVREIDVETRKSPIDSLDKDKCLEFGHALGDFKKYIMEPWFKHDLIENELLIKNKRIN